MSKEIKLTQGMVALVDDEDYERVKGHTWFANHQTRGSSLLAPKTWVEKRGKPHLVSLHRFILKLPRNASVLFRNGNPLDCRRSNMIVATHKDATRASRLKRNNTSGYKGVYRHRETSWRAFIKVDRKQKHLGLFQDPIEAAFAYDEAARLYFGEFARLNFPVEGERSAHKGRTPQPEANPSRETEPRRGPCWISRNPSGFKGSFLDLRSGRCFSAIWIKGKYRYLGTFDAPEEAALAYDEASREKYGDRARLNFPKPGEARCRVEPPLQPAA